MMTSIEGKVLRSGLDAPQHALDVDLQNRARFFCCDIHKGLHLCNPGVVEHHVEPAELLLGMIDCRVDVFAFRHVGFECRRLRDAWNVFSDQVRRSGIDAGRCERIKEFASDGITVNADCPGIVGTDMWVEIDKRFSEITGTPIGETYKKYVEGIALGRAQTPEDVAAFVSFLAGPDSDYINGQAPLIDGGSCTGN